MSRPRDVQEEFGETTGTTEAVLPHNNEVSNSSSWLVVDSVHVHANMRRRLVLAAAALAISCSDLNLTRVKAGEGTKRLFLSKAGQDGPLKRPVTRLVPRWRRKWRSRTGLES